MRDKDSGGAREGLHVREISEAAAPVALGGGLGEELHHLPGLPLPEVERRGEAHEKVGADALGVEHVGVGGLGWEAALVLGLGPRLVLLLGLDDRQVGDGFARGAVAPGLVGARVGVLHATPVLVVVLSRHLALASDEDKGLEDILVQMVEVLEAILGKVGHAATGASAGRRGSTEAQRARGPRLGWYGEVRGVSFPLSRSGTIIWDFSQECCSLAKAVGGCPKVTKAPRLDHQAWLIAAGATNEPSVFKKIFGAVNRGYVLERLGLAEQPAEL